MFAGKSFIPILVAGVQINSDVNGFFEPGDSAVVNMMKEAIDVFKCPTQKSLRASKNVIRDHMRKN